MRQALRSGFTLVELIVTLILLGILTVIVFPIVIQQIDDAEPTKMANDLVNIRTGIELFHVNVRPHWPGDLEDLVHEPAQGTDKNIEGQDYSGLGRWKGPYIDAALASGAVVTGNAILTGFDLFIQNQVVCFNPTNNTFKASPEACATGEFVALLIGNTGAHLQISTASQPGEFTAIDELLDNGDGVAAGRIRAAKAADGSALDADLANAFIVFLVAPF